MATRKKLLRASQELEEKACQMRAQGARWDEIAKVLGLDNSYQLRRYRKLFPDFEIELNEASVSYAEYIEQELEAIPHKYDADTAKILSANLMRILEFINPKRYSPRQQHDVNVSIDISGALERAKERLIDVTPNVLRLTQAVKKSESD